MTVSDYTDTGLTNGTTYYYVVTAEDNAAQESGYSSEVNATPQAVPLAVVPRDVVYSREAGVAPSMPPCGRR